MTRIPKSVAVIVAHPDDETLWAGGTVLEHPLWQWFIVCLCRGSDQNRAPRFYQVLNVLNSEGIMGDLDDGPDQQPLDDFMVQRVVLELLPRAKNLWPAAGKIASFCNYSASPAAAAENALFCPNPEGRQSIFCLCTL